MGKPVPPVSVQPVPVGAEPLPRSRTTCVYCGQRIDGAAGREEKITRAQRFAARLTCLAHRALVANDYNYRPW